MQTIRAGDELERRRQENRVKITDSANCVPPMTAEEADKNGVKINVNWGGLMLLLAHARRQYLTAFLSNQYFFKVSLPFAPAPVQSEWEAFITQEINRPLRKARGYFELHRSRWSSVVTHGVAPMMWPDKYRMAAGVCADGGFANPDGDDAGFRESGVVCPAALLHARGADGHYRGRQAE